MAVYIGGWNVRVEEGTDAGWELCCERSASARSGRCVILVCTAIEVLSRLWSPILEEGVPMYEYVHVIT